MFSVSEERCFCTECWGCMKNTDTLEYLVIMVRDTVVYANTESISNSVVFFINFFAQTEKKECYDCDQ